MLTATKALLRPLVKLMIARGLTLPTLIAALKETFVEVAHDEFRLDCRPPSDSRVSLLTGVHRKDVRAIREAAHPVSTPRAGGLGATVLGRWLGDPAYADAEGRPLLLPRQAAPPGTPSFEALVAGISKDVRPRTVLDELLRLGLVEALPGDMLRLVAEAFVPAEDEAALAFFRDNLRDHMAAAAHNLLAPQGAPRLLERAVFYNRLRGPDVDALEAEARTPALAALRHLNSLALERQMAARGLPDATQRFRFGLFFHREDTPPPPAPNPTGPS